MQETEVSPHRFFFFHTEHVGENSCQKECVGVRCELRKIEGPVRQENVGVVFSKNRGTRCADDKTLESAYLSRCVC